MQIGERIKNRRLELGISVDDLAACIDKNRATIYRYEKGDIENLPIAVLEPLAKALYTSPAYLMGWTENPNDNIISSHENKSVLSNPSDTDIEKYFRRTAEKRGSDHFISEEELNHIRDILDREKYLTPIPILMSINSDNLDFSPANIDGYIDISNEIAADYFWGHSFAMRAKDNALRNFGIEKGDLMFFDTDDDPDPHDMKGSAVLVSTNIIQEPFIRRLTLQHDGLVILDAKGDSLPMAFSYSDFINEVKIIARLVCSVKQFK